MLSFDQFQELASKQAIVSNWTELVADLDTPVSIYSKLHKNSKDTFLFESVIGGEKIGRYSFIGYKALEIIKTYEGDPYQKLTERLTEINQNGMEVNPALPFFHQGFVGYFSFETIRYIEPSIAMQKSQYPESYLILVGSMVVFDRVTQKIYLIANTLVDKKQDLEKQYQESLADLAELKTTMDQKIDLPRLDIDLGSYSTRHPSANGFESNTGEDVYKSMVETAKEHIIEGDIFQVVPSHKLIKDASIDPLKAYRILRTVNPSPYLFLYNLDLDDLGSVSLVGSSPEMIVKSSHNEAGELEAEIRPIAGTYKRGKSAEEDQKLADKLLNDPKEIAEHVMLVDLARNDLGRVCQSGSIKVAQNMIIEKYSHVQHIVSSVIGELKSELGYKSGVELFRACFPAGTLSGAPKVEAIKIIAKLEKEARGPYGGGIGYFGLDGLVDVAIIIRTMIIENNKITLQAGGGVVADSKPESELQETYNKAGALIKVVELANQ
ncbi:MAG: anthranilate synthase component I [Candidatus Melainabacteria bacterium]|nr:anthranilate synthase component I [Candidatus Melainabacteria bacterium]